MCIQITIRFHNITTKNRCIGSMWYIVLSTISNYLIREFYPKWLLENPFMNIYHITHIYLFLSSALSPSVLLAYKLWKLVHSFPMTCVHKQCIIRVTYGDRDKMAAILQTPYSNSFCELKCSNFDYNFIETNYVLEGPVDNISTLVQAMAWCRKGAKPLPEAMMIQINDAFITTSMC